MSSEVNNTKDEILVSVIVPVYKVEAYVRKAVRSIQKQTLQNWEMYLVDDGSPDRSGAICDKLAKDDDRIHVLHKENGGAPSARNMAIPLAKGKYLFFMDSDDWAEPNMLEQMVDAAEETQSQLLVSGFFIDTYYEAHKYISEQICLKEFPSSKMHVIRDDLIQYDRQQDFREDSYRLFDRNFLYPPWNKLFLREYVIEHNILFPTTLWDDFPFNLFVIRDIERVAVLNKGFYHFIRARAESETAAYSPRMYEKREEEHGWMEELYHTTWKVTSPEIEEFVARRYIERFIGCIENLTNPKSGLSHAEQLIQVTKMLQNPRVAYSVSKAQPNSWYMKLMLKPVRAKNGRLCLQECRMITWVKSHNVKMFAKLKAKR